MTFRSGFGRDQTYSSSHGIVAGGDSAKDSPPNQTRPLLPASARGLLQPWHMKNSSAIASPLVWLIVGLGAACSPGMPRGDDGGKANRGGTVGTGGTGGGNGGRTGSGGMPATGGSGGVDASVAGGAGGGNGDSGSTGGTPIVCSATYATPVPPVAVDASLSCTGSGSPFILSVASGPGPNGFVAVSESMTGTGASPSFLFDLGATSARVEQISSDAVFTFLTSSAAGVPASVLQTPGGTSNITWLTRAAAGTTPAWTSSTVTDSGSYLWDGAIAPDGSQYVLYRRYGDAGSGTLMLAKRSADGSAFTSTAVTDDPAQVGSWSTLAVDAAGEPHVSFWAIGTGLFDWQPGKAAVSAFAYSGSSTLWSLRAVRPGGVGLAFSLTLDEGLHVVRRRADAGFDDIPIPSSGQPTSVSSASHSYSCYGGSPPCPPKSESGDFAGSHRLVEAADGTLWLAYVSIHLDRTITFKGSNPNGPVCTCAAQILLGNDHSTSTLVLRRIAPGATVASGVLWSVDLGNIAGLDYPSSIMNATLSGSMIFLVATSWSPMAMHYLVVDTSKIP